MNNTTQVPATLPTNVLAVMAPVVEKKARQFFRGQAWIVTRSFSSAEWLRFDLAVEGGTHDLTFMVEVWGTDENDAPDQWRVEIRPTHDARGVARCVYSGVGATVNEAVKDMRHDPAAILNG